MKKFERIGRFDAMSKSQMSKVFGGQMITYNPKYGSTMVWTGDPEHPTPDYVQDVTGFDQKWDDLD